MRFLVDADLVERGLLGVAELRAHRERGRLRVVCRAEAGAGAEDRLVELGLEILQQVGELQDGEDVRGRALRAGLGGQCAEGEWDRAQGEARGGQGADRGALPDGLTTRDQRSGDLGVDRVEQRFVVH